MNTDTANNAENKEMSFREAMAELDKTVSVLESNTLELEDSLKAYERGVADPLRFETAPFFGAAKSRCSHGPA